MLSVKLGNCGEPRESVRREGKREGSKRRINCGGGFLPGWLEIIMRNSLIIERERERERQN